MKTRMYRRWGFLCWVLMVAWNLSVRAAVQPLPVEWTRENVAIFAGIGSYRDAGIRPLEGPPNDAVVLADLFVRGLRLVPAARVFVVIEGPLTPRNEALVGGLAAQGVRVVRTGTKADVLSAVAAACSLKTTADSILFFSVSTHGCEWAGEPHVCVSDTISMKTASARVAQLQAELDRTGDRSAFAAGRNQVLVDLQQSMVSLTGEVEGPLEQLAPGAKKILLIDACRTEVLPSRSKGAGDVALDAGAGLRGALDRATLERLKVSVLVGACSPGQESLDGQGEGGPMGLFSRVLREALLGAAATPGASTLTLSDVLSHVAVEAERRAYDSGILMGKDTVRARKEAQRAWFRGEVAALRIPLGQLDDPGRVVGPSEVASLLQRLATVAGGASAQFQAPDLLAVQRLVGLMGSPEGATYGWALPQLEGLMKNPQALVDFVRTFDARERLRADVLKRVSVLRTSTGVPDRARLDRLAGELRRTMPPEADELLKEADRQLRIGGDELQAWFRARRSERFFRRLVEAQRACAEVPARQDEARQMELALRALRPERWDELEEDLDSRLVAPGCVQLEALLGWWRGRALEDGRREVLGLLSAGRSRHPELVRSHQADFDVLVRLVRELPAEDLQPYLAQIRSRYGRQDAPEASLAELLDWFADRRRQARLDSRLDGLARWAAEVPSGSGRVLVQIASLLRQLDPRLQDVLMEELDRRLATLDGRSLELVENWWKVYECRIRGRQAEVLLRTIAANPRANASPAVLEKLAEALNTLPCPEVAELLGAVETQVSRTDLDSLSRFLGWYERRYLKEPRLPLLVGFVIETEPGVVARLGAVVQGLLQARPGPVEFELSPDCIAWQGDSPRELCRSHEARRVLLIKLGPASVRTGRSAIGPVREGEAALEGVLVRLDGETRRVTVSGEYKVPGSMEDREVQLRAYEDGLRKLLKDPNVVRFIPGNGK